MTTIEVLYAPAEFAALKERDLSRTVCVVFDVLRATSSMIAALGNGAEAIIPVEEIPEALALRKQRPGLLLAGERDGLRIRAELTGGIDFDLGNSPREFTKDKVLGRTVAMTTTNGTRALRACAPARETLIGTFLNLGAVVERLRQSRPENLLVVCSGTFEQGAYEDFLGTGAVCDAVWDLYEAGKVADSAMLARKVYQLARGDLAAALGESRNGKRLLSRPDLRDDVAFCARRNVFPFLARLGRDGSVRR
jgi:2-phosphosulfolactate phosphatase